MVELNDTYFEAPNTSVQAYPLFEKPMSDVLNGVQVAVYITVGLLTREEPANV